MAFEVIGKLHKKFDVEEKSSSFRVRNFVIVIKDGEYEQFINFQLTQDKCEIVDKFEVGSEIKVHFNLRGREWQGKYFTNLQAWRIEGDASANAAIHCCVNIRCARGVCECTPRGVVWCVCVWG